ncbi:MAG: hypothetical protein J6J75_01195 [Alistipes sp.]|nr:hypothetical protein [Alistipes sp.]
MKNIKIFYLTLVAILAGLFTACENKDFEAGPTVDGIQVYFPTTVPASYYLGEDENSVTIPVKRIVTDEAAVINILGSDESELFDIPSSVSFAAGENTAALKITFDRSKLVDGTEYPVSLLINDENNTTPYGESSLSIIIAPWPWILEGEGLFRDDWFTSMFRGDASANIPVRIHRHKTREGIYMIEDMYGWNFLEPFFGYSRSEIEAGLVRYTPTNITINCSDPNGVFIPRQFSGITDIDSSYGDYEIATLQDGLGKLEDGIITFPERGLALFCLKGGQYANTSGMFRIVFPGIEIADYSLAAEYDGMKIEADGTTASAYVNFTYGDDATGFHYTVASGNLGDNDIEAAVAAIVDGTNEDVVKVTELAEEGNTVTEKFALPSGGAYTLVAVALDKEGKPTVKGATSIKFYFPGAGGGTAPDCEIAVELMKVSEFNPNLVAQYPDETSLAAMITGKELSEVTYYVNTTSLINAIDDGSMGLTWEEVMSAYGSKWTSKQFDFLEANGYWGTVFSNMKPATSYSIVVLAKNNYGKSALATATCSTAAAEYSGEMVIGDYTMVCGEGENASENIFNVAAVSSTSVTDFLATDFVWEDGIEWTGVYDPAALTLTLTSSDLGKWYITTIQGTNYAYGVFSFNEAVGNTGKDPVVVTIDSATKQLKGLNTGMHVEVDLATITSDNKIDEIIGAMAVYDATSVIAPYVETSSVSSFLKKKTNSIVSRTKVPYRNFDMNDLKVANRKEALKSGVCGTEMRMERKLATLKVNAQACEPLHKAFDRRAAQNGSALLEAMK